MIKGNYKHLDFYKSSREIVILIYEITKKFPKEEQGFTGLVNQMRRAIISVVSNIAEGSTRREKEHYHFLVMSLGSLREIETQLGVSYDLNFTSKEKYELINEKVNISIAKLCAYMRVIGKDIFQKRNF